MWRATATALPGGDYRQTGWGGGGSGGIACAYVQLRLEDSLQGY